MTSASHFFNYIEETYLAQEKMKMPCPGEDFHSPPEQELLGAITSHGPSRESYTPAKESSDWPTEAFVTSAAEPAVSAERLRPALSSAASAPALLQRRVPDGGAEMVEMEGAAEISGNEVGPSKAE